MTFSRILAAVVIVAATLWIGSGVLGRTETPDATTVTATAQPATPRFRVAVVETAIEQHSRRLVLSGHTEADDRASAIARAAGSIVSLNVRRGDVVKEGDVIATLSDEAREALVKQAQALVEQRQADLAATEQLVKRGVTPVNQRNQDEANLRAAEAALAVAQAEFERGIVRAPISGVISNAPMTTGQAMAENGMVAEVIALDPMLAVAEIAERQLGEVKVGDPASVRLVTGQTAEGKVRFISPTASKGTRTYRVEVQVDNANHAIADGVTSEIEFRLAPVAAARLPRSALTFSAGGELCVKTVDTNGVVASVPVSVVEDARDEIWLAGPTDGSLVVVQGQDFVSDGQEVEPVAAGTQTPAQVSKS